MCSATHPVRDCRELADADFDAVIVAAFERPDAEMARLEAIGVPHDQLVPHRPPANRAARGDLGKKA